MSKYRVRIAEEAEKDLAELVDYIAFHDSAERASFVLDRLFGACERLEANPGRGHFLPELLEFGIKSFREVHYKPYRIVYEIIGRTVHILLIVDGRRSLRSVLERRLLR